MQTTTLKATLILLISLFYVICSNAQETDYVLVIDGDSIGINLNNTIDITKNGQNMKVQLIEKEIKYFSDEMISFAYKSANGVSKTILDEGISQVMTLSATGNGVMVQEYIGFDPEFMVDMMLNEVTKESISYGYKGTAEADAFTTKDGVILKGKKMELTYQADVSTYEVYSLGGKDKGILVVTIANNTDPIASKELIDSFKNSLKIKFEQE